MALINRLWETFRTTSQLTAPGEERRRWVRELSLIVLTVISLFGLAVVLGWLAGLYRFLPVIIVMIMVGASSTGYFLTLKGFWRAGTLILPLIFLAIGVYGSINVGFAQSMQAFYIISILLASMLMGGRWRWIFVVIATSLHLGLSQANFPVSAPAFFAYFITTGSTFLGTALLDWYATRSLLRALEVSLQTNQALEQEMALRQQAQAELNDQSLQLKRLTDHTTDLVGEIDSQGIYRYVSPSHFGLLGYLAHELIGNSLYELIHPDDQVFVHQVMEQATRQRGPAFFEARLRSAGGGYVWVEISATPLPELGGLDMPPVFVISGRDITARQLAEERLRQSETRFRSIVQSSPLGIHLYRLDANDRLIFEGSNPAADLLTGLDNRQFVGKTIEAAFPALAETEVPDRYRRAARGEAWRTEQITYDDGRISGAFEVHAFQAEPGKAAVMFQDVTLRRRAEQEQRRLNRALRTLSECNQAVVRASDEATLLRDLCQVMVAHGGYRLAWIGYCTGGCDGRLLPVAHAWGGEQPPSGLTRLWSNTEDKPSGQSVVARQLIMVPDMEAVEGCENCKETATLLGFRALLALPLVYEQYTFGSLNLHAVEPNAFDAEEMALLNELANDLAFGIHTLRVRAENRHADGLVRQARADLAQAYEATLEGWALALELRERETAGHSRRVVNMTCRIAQAMGWSKDQLIHVRRGAILHDIGKMGIPDAILLKAGPLTAEEWTIMRQHPLYAFDLLKNIEYLLPALDIPFSHHERWDGSGYPRGLKGADIPLAARIFAVVDVYDALRSERSYRKAWSEQEALAYLLEQSGKQFDPQVIEWFFSLRQTGALDERSLAATFGENGRKAHLVESSQADSGTPTFLALDRRSEAKPS